MAKNDKRTALTEVEPRNEATGLTLLQEKVLSLWFTCKSQKEIAELVGVNPCTISIWKNEPAFRAELARVTEENRKRASDILAQGTTDAAYMLTVLAQRADRQACVDVLKAGNVYVEQHKVSVEQATARVASELERVYAVLVRRYGEAEARECIAKVMEGRGEG